MSRTPLCQDIGKRLIIGQVWLTIWSLRNGPSMAMNEKHSSGFKQNVHIIKRSLVHLYKKTKIKTKNQTKTKNQKDSTCTATLANQKPADKSTKPKDSDSVGSGHWS